MYFVYFLSKLLYLRLSVVLKLNFLGFEEVDLVEELFDDVVFIVGLGVELSFDFLVMLFELINVLNVVEDILLEGCCFVLKLFDLLCIVETHGAELVGVEFLEICELFEQLGLSALEFTQSLLDSALRMLDSELHFILFRLK